MAHKIELEVSDKALQNFKTNIENETGYKVTDPLALIKHCLQGECGEDHLECYSYYIIESDVFHDEDWPGLDKTRG